MSAHTPASASVPRRVASMRRNCARGDLVVVVVVAIVGPFLLIGEYRDTRCRRVEIALVAGAAVVDARDVLDVVADDVAIRATSSGPRVIPLARAGVREAAALPIPAGYVEEREVPDRQRSVATARE